VKTKELKVPVFSQPFASVHSARVTERFYLLNSYCLKNPPIVKGVLDFLHCENAWGLIAPREGYGMRGRDGVEAACLHGGV